ncbi:hypothetical protein [Synechococcus sp. RSCCF101]|uniref:hypothetical protein n=1 Tax=Synechococcus sp. RSCCF101 TaxID=2511069 RepID=UPI001CD94C3B|nr:hypothetical protein [Synechococcus sp. RSCCF101]
MQVSYVEGPEPVPCAVDSGMDAYLQLQIRCLLATAALGVVASLISALIWGMTTSLSVLVGAVAGVLYLRLLARSVARLGSNSRQIGRFQLVVPVLLVVGVSRLPSLDLLPAILGFLVYKPALLVQAAFEP